MMQVNVTRDDPAGSAYVVQRPRESDAIGDALRSAYAQPRPTLPSDLRDMLDRLDARD